MAELDAPIDVDQTPYSERLGEEYQVKKEDAITKQICDTKVISIHALLICYLESVLSNKPEVREGLLKLMLGATD